MLVLPAVFLLLPEHLPPSRLLLFTYLWCLLSLSSPLECRGQESCFALFTDRSQAPRSVQAHSTQYMIDWMNKDAEGKKRRICSQIGKSKLWLLTTEGKWWHRRRVGFSIPAQAGSFSFGPERSIFLRSGSQWFRCNSTDGNSPGGAALGCLFQK